jgi:hypothetical protein
MKQKSSRIVFVDSLDELTFVKSTVEKLPPFRLKLFDELIYSDKDGPFFGGVCIGQN